MKIFYSIILMFLFLATPVLSLAQELVPGIQAIWEAEVVEVISQKEEKIAGTEVTAINQELSVRLLEGEKEGELVSFDNNMVLLSKGDIIYVTYVTDLSGSEYFSLKDVKRHNSMMVLLLVFVILLVLFAGRQGVRALASLVVSIGAIVFVLVPAMLAGYDPILVSLLVAGMILAVVLFGTHGINPISLIAFGGTVSAVVITSVLSWIFVSWMRLTGFGSDAAVYLNFATDGELDFVGLLLGSIIIGILGVLDDVSITQASVVGELKSANVKLNMVELYNRAIKVGRDHVGSLVNTLALAYVGAALPLVLLFSTSEYNVGLTLNQEIIAAEIVRIIIGSIGLILAVPFTTALAAWWFDKNVPDLEALSHHSHTHN